MSQFALPPPLESNDAQIAHIPVSAQGLAIATPLSVSPIVDCFSCPQVISDLMGSMPEAHHERPEDISDHILEQWIEDGHQACALIGQARWHYYFDIGSSNWLCL